MLFIPTAESCNYIFSSFRNKYKQLGGLMDGVSGVDQSVQALNQILQMATSESLEMAEKLVKVAVSMGLEQGKGENIDVSA